MEDRVKNILEKEHSKRFRAMCHRNENLTQENKFLLDFYDKEKKKCLHSFYRESCDLRNRMTKLSQEKFVNSLMDRLTEITFQKSGSNIPNDLVNNVTSLQSVESESDNSSAPRYLRIQQNEFQPSQMTFDSYNSSQSLNSSQGEINDGNKEEEVLEETEKEKVENDGMGTHDLVKKVAEKLTGNYDLNKLKFLTQVILKTLQNNDRSRYEDKSKLVYNLNKYLNQNQDSSLPTEDRPALRKKSSGNSLGDSTFLFLKADRRQEIRQEQAKLKRNQSKGLSKSRRQTLFELPSIDPCKVSCHPADKRKHSQTTITHTSVDKPANELDDILEADKIDDMMKIYLNLGHGALLKLPETSRALTRAKQRPWLRCELSKFPIIPKNNVQDLRVVMKNCRYLRFPKDMQHELQQ